MGKFYDIQMLLSINKVLLAHDLTRVCTSYLQLLLSHKAALSHWDKPCDHRATAMPPTDANASLPLSPLLITVP